MECQIEVRRKSDFETAMAMLAMIALRSLASLAV
jgi:hypothetical protein